MLLAPKACPYPPKYVSQSQIRYTGIHSIDQGACLGTEFLTVALFRHIQPFTIHFFANLSSFLLIVSIEGAREDGPSRWFTFLTSALSVTSAAGIAMPLAWFYIFLSSNRDAQRPLTRQAGEGVLLSLTLGYLLPTVSVISTKDERLMVIWGLIPVTMAVIEHLWLSIRPPTSETGGFSTRIALFTTLVVSSFTHLAILFRYAQKVNWVELGQWLPKWSAVNPDTANLTEAVMLQFLQWDAIFTYASGIAAGFLFTDSWAELLLYIMATPMVLLALGPGAVVSAMWIWREWKLNILAEQQTQRLLDKNKKST